MFGPKILRVLRGQGDKWDHRSRARGITASFCINGGGLMPEEGVDLYQENEELKVNNSPTVNSVDSTLIKTLERKRRQQYNKTFNLK